MNVAIVYMPVLHAGYLQFFQSLPKSTQLYLLTPEVLEKLPGDFDYLIRKDVLRSVDVHTMLRAVEVLVDTKHLSTISLLNHDALETLSANQDDIDQLFVPDDDISAALLYWRFGEVDSVRNPIFLRWHRDNVAEEKAVESHSVVAMSELDRKLMQYMQKVANGSHDWWRQVGAVLVQNGEIRLSACNQHQPHPQSACAHGDPRSLFSRGIRLELTTAEHAEAAVLAEAARRGIATQDGSLYVSAFPCPTCAMLIARAGIKTCYFGGGYAVLDGESVLKAAGVELVLVKQ